MEGIIFDIKEFTIHDGPGARVTVFLKGCPLRCVWCHNPEGLHRDRQIMYKEVLCIQCGNCKKVCDHEECKAFGRCAYACMSGALSVSGEVITSEKLAQKILKNSDFFQMSGGGVTISGGEPMMQAEFVCDVAEKLSGIHKAIQTSGYADEECYLRVIDKFDYIMQDIKLADSKLHKAFTGVDNQIILRNIKLLKKSGKDFVFRVPLIPNITDTEENLTRVAEIAEDYRVELLKYNSFAGAKYKMLGKSYSLHGTKEYNNDVTKFFNNAVLL